MTPTDWQSHCAGYTVVVYCRACRMDVASIGPYSEADDLFHDAKDMLMRHKSKVHGEPA